MDVLRAVADGYRVVVGLYKGVSAMILSVYPFAACLVLILIVGMIS